MATIWTTIRDGITIVSGFLTTSDGDFWPRAELPFVICAIFNTTPTIRCKNLGVGNNECKNKTMNVKRSIKITKIFVGICCMEYPRNN